MEDRGVFWRFEKMTIPQTIHYYVFRIFNIFFEKKIGELKLYTIMFSEYLIFFGVASESLKIAQ